MCPPPGLILSAPTQPRDPTADAAQSKLPVSNKSSFCPPLQSATLDISCYLDSSDRPCEEPQPPGTVVLFKCKPQYSGDLRSGNATHCGPGGTWTRPLPSCKPEGCPPLQWPTVLAECTHDGQPVACSEQPSPTGTVARFRCKPLHQFLFGYLPSSGLESRCRSDREWSTTPFRCAPICGQPTGKAIGFVRDGILSNSAADFPWHVSIYDRTLDNEQVCGGSLITTKFFVSAAHCFHNGTFHPETIYLAGFGKIKRSVDVVEANEQYRKLRKIYLKDYGGRNQLYSNDISIVELQSDVDITSSTMPVCMDWSFDLPELQHGDLGVVVGYGNTLDNPHADLHFAKLPFIKSDECKHRVSDSLAIYNKLQDKFCIGFINRSTVAKGDSGGGIAFPNKDRVWFLRGIVSVGSSQETTYSFFTNVTKFIPWISATIQQGEVTGRRCGVDVSQEGPESGGQYGFPWEVDLYFKRTSNRKFEILSTGALIQRNLVITRVRSDSTSGQAIDLSEYPVTWLRVASRRSAVFENLEKAANVSQVIRAFSPSDVTAKSGLFYNFILLELRTPLHLMPVCVDWTGSALLQKQHHGTVISNQKSENSSLSTRQYILSPTECKFKITPPPENHHICTLQDGDKEKTSSLYVFANNNWFLRGVESRALHSPNGTISVYTDMGDPGVRQWLTKTNHILGKATCGNVNLCESLSSGMSLAGHLPWNVAVVAVDETGKQTKHSAILIKPNAVLTASAFLVDMIHWNGKGKLPKFPVNNITVIWTAFDGNTKTSRVSRVIVRDVGESLRDDQPRVDVALLELRGDKPLPTMTPVCLDFSGSVLQELATGQLGLNTTNK
ncbi:hypothetical protein FOCC_FOCC012392 [Frankliniella occidentalis]|nr:hypothetical protein FOCC_FOCC012392 [Frankliniella occidentalis]